jgi:hypothetical protein
LFLDRELEACWWNLWSGNQVGESCSLTDGRFAVKRKGRRKSLRISLALDLFKLITLTQQLERHRNRFAQELSKSVTTQFQVHDS